MQSKRGELIPVGKIIGGLSGPVQALRETPPPARRGFTLADQVNQLVSASEADSDLGFMARMMALCSLPRTNPGNRIDLDEWRQRPNPDAGGTNRTRRRSTANGATNPHPFSGRTRLSKARGAARSLVFNRPPVEAARQQGSTL